MYRFTHLALALGVVAATGLTGTAQAGPRYDEYRDRFEAQAIYVGGGGGGTSPVESYRYVDADGVGQLQFRVQPLAYVGGGGTAEEQLVVRIRQNRITVYGFGTRSAADVFGVKSLRFTLFDDLDRAYTFQGNQDASAPAPGQSIARGIYVSPSGRQFSWAMYPESGGGSPPGYEIRNDRPVLRDYWETVRLSDGSSVYFTYNTTWNVESSATWSGSLPAAGRRYDIQVWIPAQLRIENRPRTRRAAYEILYPDGALAVSFVDQQPNTPGVSEWVSLGTFVMAGSYQVRLTDATGEAGGSHKLVAGPLKLVPTR